MPAYVVVWIDYEKRPPVAVRADICSEEHPSSTTSVIPYCVFRAGAVGMSWEDCEAEAEREVALMAKNQPEFQWIQEQLEKQPWRGGKE